MNGSYRNYHKNSISSIGTILQVLFSLILSAQISFSTPSPNTWKRIVFLGANDDYFYTLVFSRENPGLYFEDYDTLFVQKQSNQTGEIIERTRAITCALKDTTGMGDWSYRIDTTNEFDLLEFLTMEKALLGFPFTQHEIVISEKAAWIGQDSLAIPLLSDQEICSPFGGADVFKYTNKDGPFLHGVYQCGPTWKNRDYIYLVLQDSPHWNSEGISIQRVVPLAFDKYSEAVRRYTDLKQKKKE